MAVVVRVFVVVEVEEEWDFLWEMDFPIRNERNDTAVLRKSVWSQFAGGVVSGVDFHL